MKRLRRLRRYMTSVKNRTSIKKRIAVIAANTANNIALPVYSLLFSLIVIRFCSDMLWGQFVSVLLGVNLGAHFLTWGNKEYLLRSFSLHPAQAESKWRQNIFTRALLLVLVPLIWVVSPVGMKVFLIIAFWIVAKFIYQSYEVIIVYKNKFTTTLVLESMGILVVSAIILTDPTIRLARLLCVAAGADAIKSLLVAFCFRRLFSLKMKGITLDFKIFTQAFPFFLLGFTGLLQSRMDQLVVNFYLPGKEIARYQVYVNFLLYLQAGSGFLLIPFVKNIYRLPFKTIKRISLRLFAASVLLVPMGMGVVYSIVTFLYKLNVSFPQLIIGGLFALPIFYYSPLIYFLFKQGRQYEVIIIIVSGIAINLVAALFLIPVYGITGPLLGAMLSQWMMMSLFYYRTNYSDPGKGQSAVY